MKRGETLTVLRSAARSLTARPGRTMRLLLAIALLAWAPRGVLHMELAQGFLAKSFLELVTIALRGVLYAYVYSFLFLQGRSTVRAMITPLEWGVTWGYALLTLLLRYALYLWLVFNIESLVQTMAWFTPSMSTQSAILLAFLIAYAPIYLSNLTFDVAFIRRLHWQKQRIRRPLGARRLPPWRLIPMEALFGLIALPALILLYARMPQELPDLLPSLLVPTTHLPQQAMTFESTVAWAQSISYFGLTLLYGLCVIQTPLQLVTRFMLVTRQMMRPPAKEGD